MPLFFTGSAKFNVSTKDELTLASSPPPAMSRTVTRMRWINNDTVSHTPDFRVKSKNADRVQANHEYVRVIPKRAVAAGGEIDEDRSPVTVLAPDETFVVEHAVDPTNDPDKWPSILIVWLDEALLPQVK